ncbi:PREDICTED: multiple coagulation factor deficiency protein 2-like [Rhagoletis zephyria]|uniref:multiple coagulation factor deficiency protein 2-like n=1 Tax=Rhagoletis zephyria TaxID=28612 RepID=UPI0008112C06|nr:PREDICTED: multiple coagulation factor deficiency protein 2-like [Rhagoletis zephyria]
MKSFNIFQQMQLAGYGFWCAYLVQDAHGKKTEQPLPQQHDGATEESGKVYSDENLSEIIDYVLKRMDLNNDGYVDYAEYRKSEEADMGDDHEKINKI